MRKFFCAMTSLFLLIALYIPASAAGTIPWYDEAEKISVISNFDSYNGAIDLKNEEAFWSGGDPSEFAAQWKDGKLVITKCVTGRQFRLGDPDGAGVNGEGSFANAEGIGFYMENNTGSAASVAPFMISDGCFIATTDTVYYLIDSDNKVTKAEIASNSAVIPAGFKGYVAFMLDTIVDQWAGNAAFDPATDYIKYPGFGIEAPGVSDKQTIVFDNLFMFGTNITENNGGIQVTVTKPDEETAAPEETNAPEKTDEPSQQTQQPDNTTAAAAATTAAAVNKEEPVSAVSSDWFKDWGIYAAAAVFCLLVSTGVIFYTLKKIKNKPEN